MPIQLWKKFFWGLQLTLSVQEKTLLEDYHQSESATLRATTQSPNRPWLHLLMQQPNCPISFVSTVETIDQLMGCLHQSKIQDTPHSKLFFESFEPHSQKCRQQLILWIVNTFIWRRHFINIFQSLKNTKKKFQTLQIITFYIDHLT